MSSSSLARWVPALDWLRAYNGSLLRGDILAGITLAAYLLPAALGDASLATLPPQSWLVGGFALALIILGQLFFKHKPVAVFVVIGGIIAATALSLETRGVKLIGAVPQGIPPLKVPTLYWRDLNELLPLALACFLLG